MQLVAKASADDIAQRYLRRRAASQSAPKPGGVAFSAPEFWAWYTNQAALVLVNLDTFQKADYLQATVNSGPTPSGKTCMAMSEELRVLPEEGTERARRWEAVLALQLRRIGLEESAPPRPSSSYSELASAAAMAELVRPGAGEPLPAGVVRLLRGKLRAGSNEEEEWNCELSKWMERRILSDPPRFKAELDAFIYETMDAQMEVIFDTLATQRDAFKGAPDGVPLAAYVFGVQGSVQVEATVGADGKAVEATVVKRTVKVPGLLGAPPIGFERLFDAAAIDHAMSRDHRPLLADRSLGQRVIYEINWKPDEAGPQPTPTHARSGKPS